MYSRRSIQCIDDQPSVVRDRDQSCFGDGRARLQVRIFEKGIRGLLDGRRIGIVSERDDFGGQSCLRKDMHHFSTLFSIGRCHQKLLQYDVVLVT